MREPARKWENLETLSMVMLDYDFDVKSQIFELDAVFYADGDKFGTRFKEAAKKGLNEYQKASKLLKEKQTQLLNGILNWLRTHHERGVSNPYFFNNSIGLPLSPNVSFVPTYSIGIGQFLAATCAMLSPSPPKILCSSAVTAHFVFLIDCMCYKLIFH